MNRWQGHVIVCGLHGLGVRVVEQLQAADVTVVVVDDDPDPRLARLVHGWGVPHLADNPRIAQTLEDAGADRAAALLCMESDDLHTLEVALLARERYPDLRIVARLSNPAVGSALADIVGERSVLDVAEVTAPAAGAGGALALCPGRDMPVSEGDTVTVLGRPQRRDRRRRVPVPCGGRGAADRLRPAGADRRDGAARAGRRLDGRADPPPGRSGRDGRGGRGVLHRRDRRDRRHRRLRRLLLPGTADVAADLRDRADARGRRHGDPDLRLADQRAGESAPGGATASAASVGVPVVIGDATLRSTLESANVARAGAVALLTSNDLTNLETGIAVRDLAGDHREIPIVLRVYDRQLARTVASGFGFRQVRSTAALAAPWFVGEALGLEVISTFYVGDQLLLIGQITVAAGSELDGIAMDSLGADVRVVAITRHGTTERRDLPRRATRMFAGDIAHLVGGCEDLFRVVRRNAPAAQV